MYAVAQLSASLAHEIRNPLGKHLGGCGDFETRKRES